MIARTRLIVVPFLILAFGFLCASQASAAEWDRFPDPRSHVGIKKRFDGPKYSDLRRCMRGLDSRVGADYHAGLVDITDKEGSRARVKNDARPYADALFEEWGLDESEDILMVIGVRNRSLGVRPGTKWQKLGLDERTIDETVEASDYEKFRRRGDYGQALCSLATALDYRLAALEQSMKRRVERIGSRLPELAEEHKALSARVEDIFAKEHEYGGQLREKLELAETFLQDAEKTLEKDPAKAVNLADNAGEAMTDVREKLQTYKSEVQELDDIEAKIKSLERQIENRDDLESEGPQEALSMLDTCKEQVEETRQTLERNPSAIRVCLAGVETRLARADVHHEYRSEVVPTVVTVALILIAIVIIVVLFLRRRRTLRWLRPELDGWERELEDVHERLSALTQRFPHYFEPREAWIGQSESLDAEIRTHTTRAALLRERGAALVEQARDYADSVIPLAILGPERALRLLRETQVQLQRGSRPESSPIDAELTQPFETPASQLRGEVYQSLVEGVQLLEDAASEFDEIAELRDRADEHYARIRTAVKQRQALGLPMLDIRTEVREASSEYERIKEMVDRDPLAAHSELEQLDERLDAMATRLDGANEAYERVTGPLQETGEALRNRIRELKRKGIDIEESGFSPASELDSAARLSEQVEALAQEGRGEQALEKARELADELDDLQHLIAVSEEAEDVVPAAVDAIKEQRDALKSDILKLRVAIGRAQEESDDSRGRMAQVSELQSSLSDRELHLNRIRRALHKGRILTAAADAARSVHLLERGKRLTLQLAEELDVEPETLQAPETSWPAIWRHSSLASWRSARFGSAGSNDLPW